MNTARTERLLRKIHGAHEQMLRTACAAAAARLDEFQDWVYRELQALGIQPEEFRVAGRELEEQPAFRASYPDPASLPDGPANVVGQIGPEASDGILLYAHADKRPDAYRPSISAAPLLERDGKYFGLGIADDVSGVAAMLSALRLYLELGYRPRKRIMVASVLGKQGGVFGTYGLMRRYHPLTAAVYVHPAESGGGLSELKIASNGLIEFELRVAGKGPDSTEVHQGIFSRSAVSAVDKLFLVHQKLQEWAGEQSVRFHHERVHALAGQSFALTAGRMICGEQNESFEIPIRGRLQGTLAFSPNASLEIVRREFEEAIERIKRADPWLAQGNLTLAYGDRIGDAAESDPDSDLIRASTGVVEAFTGKAPSLFYGHSLSDIRYPLLYWKAKGCYGIGPLAGQLGTDYEWVDREEYFLLIAILAELLNEVCGVP